MMKKLNERRKNVQISPILNQVKLFDSHINFMFLF